jgi:O-antigen/teichoic acid export membrane protein
VDLATKIITVPSILLLVMFWRTDVRAYLWGTLIGEGLVLAAATGALYRIRRIALKHLYWPFLWELMLFGMPLAACELAKVGLDMCDRFLVQFYLGAKAVGYYAASYNIASYLQNSLIVPLGLTLPPIYMRLWTTRGGSATAEFLGTSLRIYIVIAGAVVSLTAICSSDAMTLLASAKYREAHHLLPVLITGLMFYGIHLFLNAGFFIYRKTALAACLIGLSCILKILLNCFLLPVVGLQGAALATLLSYVVLIIAMAVVGERYLAVRMPYITGLKAGVGGSAVLLLSRIDVGATLWNCMVRGVLGVLLYGLVLYAIDNEVREMVGRTTSRLRGRGKAARAPLIAAE